MKAGLDRTRDAKTATNSRRKKANGTKTNGTPRDPRLDELLDQSSPTSSCHS